MKTPPGHLALKVDEYGAATEDKRSMSLTIAAKPHGENAALFVKEAPGTEPAAGQPALSSAGAPAKRSDAHAFMMSQETRGISLSINEETRAVAIQL
eukprot:414784-Pyramimonas_sp.AAC.1